MNSDVLLFGCEIIAVVVSAIFSVKKDEIFKTPKSNNIAFALNRVLFLLSCIIALKYPKPQFLFSAAVIFLLQLPELINIPEKISPRLVKFAKKAVFAAFLLEVTLFNINAWANIQYNSSPCSLNLKNGEITCLSGKNPSCLYNEKDNTITINGKNEAAVTFENVNMPINTLYIDVEFLKNTSNVNVILDISDETNASYRQNIAKATIIKDRNATNTIPCEFSGNVKNLRIKYTLEGSKDSVKINGITANVPVPFKIYPLRFIFIVIFSSFIWALLYTKKMNSPYNEHTGLCNYICIVLTAIAVSAAIAIVARHSHIYGFNILAEKMASQSGDQITQELTDMFEKGRLSLEEAPPKELLELENPYDWSARLQTDTEYLWDHLLYNGKYYSYYGIAPVICLFLPYHIITGCYFPTEIAVLLFTAAGIILLSLAYIKLIEKRFSAIPVNAAVSGLAILLCACGIWYSAGRPKFYEIAVSSCFACLCGAALLLFSAGFAEKCPKKISLVKTALSSLLFALAVLCRPTAALYAIAACLFYVFGLKYVQKGRRIAYTLCASAPLAFFGIVQMAYNYLRFGSPLNFGIKYSLTINDFIHSAFHLRFLLIGIYNYLFAPPAFNMSFPMFTHKLARFDINGYYFADLQSGIAPGVLFAALPVFGYIFSKKAYALADIKDRLKNALLVGLPCVVMPFIIVCSVWESGYAVRYSADINWEIIIGAYVILFFLYTKTKNATIKRLFVIFMIFSMASALIVNFMFIFNQAFPQKYYPQTFYDVSKLFEFWK